MRLVAALALAVCAAPAAAQPASVPSLAANEVLLEVNAAGTVISRADLATYRISIEVQGESPDDARRQMAERIRRLTAAAASAGIPAADVEAEPVRIATIAALGAIFDVVEEPPPPETDSVAGTPAEAPQPVPATGATATGALVIRLRDMSRDEALHNALAEIEGGHNFFSPGPIYTLSDPRRQRNEARMRALTAARAEAEDYAAALGMRVARVVRVTDRVGVDLLSMMMSESGRQAAATMRESNGPNVVTVMPIGVDFVLAPR